MNGFRLLKAPFIIARDLVKLVIVYTPGSLGVVMRSAYYRRKFKKCGRNITIDVGVIINSPEMISVGDNVHIDKYCIISTGKKLLGKIKRKDNLHFKHEIGEVVIGSNVHLVEFCIVSGYGGVAIGDNCTLSAGTKIYSLSNLPYDPDDRKRVVSIMPYEQAPFILSPVVLHQNVWAGLQVLIMPGITIGKNSFVTSNSLVMGEFSENSYLAGQPAKKIRNRYEL
jgi:acetyltransferase-like isoleucine patch superfamily enzyme